jgi:tetratricopeptide (TPR) repeat protein
MQISSMARRAAQHRDWASVHRGAQHLLTLAPDNPEGHFLQGLFEKASSNPMAAIASFEQALALDDSRYDAAIELANQYVDTARCTEAITLLATYESYLENSPRYLDLAGTVYSTLDLPEQAWPLYRKANELQPDIDLFRANLAGCAVYLGNIDEAEQIYNKLLDKHPDHQRNHYHLSRLRTAKDDRHVATMLKVLRKGNLPPAQNIFLHYALGKELEDLERWEESFSHYKQGADAAHDVSGYDVQTDIAIIDAIIETCSSDWLADRQGRLPSPRQPVFVFGLPRTGSTLTERIISSHSTVKSIGETQHFENLLRAASGVNSPARMSPEIVHAARSIDFEELAGNYLNAVSYHFDEEPRFLEKLPYNFLYAGFIARAFPDAHMVYVKRHPLDACFAMYKQVFTWAYQFSYNLDDLADYYIAHRRLLDHWLAHLGDQMVTVEYETMVRDQEGETRRLLDDLGLPFEPQCLDFQSNQSASTTASSVQIRQPIYTGSVAKWTRFSEQLSPLRERLEAAGIEC